MIFLYRQKGLFMVDEYNNNEDYYFHVNLVFGINLFPYKEINNEDYKLQNFPIFLFVYTRPFGRDISFYIPHLEFILYNILKYS